MRLSAIVLLLLLPTAVLAQNYQNYQGVNQQDMQKMMEQVQKMQACMDNIDQEKLRELEQRSMKFNEELEVLCAEGKRDEAQAKAIAFGREYSNDPTLLEMSKCGEIMQGAVPYQTNTLEQYKEEDYANRHVCDSITE